MLYTVVSVDTGWVGNLDGEHKIRPNFKVSEFACSNGSSVVLVSSQTLNWIQEIREFLRNSIRVTSSHRPLEYNRKIGSSDKSQHVLGTAVDLACPRYLTVEQFADVIKWVTGGNCGIGIYKESNFVHLDSRGYKARWYG